MDKSSEFTRQDRAFMDITKQAGLRILNLLDSAGDALEGSFLFHGLLPYFSRERDLVCVQHRTSIPKLTQGVPSSKETPAEQDVELQLSFSSLWVLNT